MSDGLPSFAPQWLKSGSSSGLGAGTQGSSSAGKGDGQKAGNSWQQRGSRLGLGAGADREPLANPDPKPLPSAGRRPGGGPADRNKGFQGDRSVSYRSGSGRELSDRELVEQTSSLKLRSGGWNPADSAGPETPYSAGSQRRNGERGGFGPRSGHRASNRKMGGQYRATPVHPRTPERDFASLGRNTSMGQSGNSRLRQGPPVSPTSVPEHPWTSSLAEAPTEATQLPLSSELGSSAQPGNETGGKSTPRMADAIVQAQESAAHEAAKATKARMEQIALRQSKQLVPVIAGPKPKHSANSGHIPATSSLTLPKKPSGLEPLGRPSLSTLSTARKDEDALNGGKRTPLSAQSPAARDSAAVSSASPRGPAAGKPTRERDRLAFFGSLRRKTSGGELMGSGDHAYLVTQSQAPSDATSDAGQGSPKRIDSLEAASEVRPEMQAAAESAQPREKPAQNGKVTEAEMPEMTPEEIAFMRSLGWEEAVDEEGGLTEEEVAAFRAKRPPNAGKSSLQMSLPLVLPRASNLKASLQKAHPRGFQSGLEFSDNDSD